MSKPGTFFRAEVSKSAILAIVLAALVLTAITMFLLPALDSFSTQHVEPLEYRPVNVVALPPKVPPKPLLKPPTEHLPENTPSKIEVLKPHLEEKNLLRHKPTLPIRTDFAIPEPVPDLSLALQVSLEPEPLPTVNEVPGFNVEPVEEGMTFDSDEVDAAPETLFCPRPQFPYRAKIKGVNGTVRVAFTVMENGNTDSVDILAAEPPGYFEEAARAAILKWRFKPGQKQGKTVRTRVKTTIEFKLLDE